MGQRAKPENAKNHARQVKYLRKGIVMLPKLNEEGRNKK